MLRRSNSSALVKNARQDNCRTAQEHRGDDTLSEVQPDIKELGDILQADGGPFAHGHTMVYPDLSCEDASPSSQPP